MRRFSRGTPHILTSADMEVALKSLTPRLIESVTAVLGLTEPEWADMTDRQRIRRLIDFENSAALTAVLVASAKSHQELEAIAFPTVQHTNGGRATSGAVIAPDDL